MSAGEDVFFCPHNSLSKLRNKFQYCYWEFTMKAARKVPMNYVLDLIITSALKEHEV